MDSLYAWVRNVISCLCLLELFCHLVRGGEYRRYIRFFGGLVILLMILSPVGNLFSMGASFEEALRLAFAREEVYELQASREALAGLQSRKIGEAYREELERQFAGIVKAHGQQSISVQVTLQEGETPPAGIEEVSILLMPRNQNLNVFEEDEENRRLQQKAADAIRDEIAALYGVEKTAVHVSVKE